MESPNSPSPRGVAFAAAGTVFTAAIGVWTAYLTVDNWRGDFPRSFSLCTAAATVLALASTWANAQVLRMQARGSIPRFRDGHLELKIPDSMRPAFLVTIAGGWLFTVSGFFLILAVATETPWLSEGVRVLGVATLGVLWIGFVAWAVVTSRILSARFDADLGGIRWVDPARRGTGQLRWDEVAHIRYRRRGLTRKMMEIQAGDGRTRRISIWDPSIPISREAEDALTSELEGARVRAAAT
jgi:hypothetical protein